MDFLTIHDFKSIVWLLFWKILEAASMVKVLQWTLPWRRNLRMARQGGRMPGKIWYLDVPGSSGSCRFSFRSCDSPCVAGKCLPGPVAVWRNERQGLMIAACFDTSNFQPSLPWQGTLTTSCGSVFSGEFHAGNMEVGCG